MLAITKLMFAQCFSFMMGWQHVWSRSRLDSPSAIHAILPHHYGYQCSSTWLKTRASRTIQDQIVGSGSVKFSVGDVDTTDSISGRRVVGSCLPVIVSQNSHNIIFVCLFLCLLTLLNPAYTGLCFYVNNGLSLKY